MVFTALSVRPSIAQSNDNATCNVAERGTSNNTKGYSSTYIAMGFANVRAGTWYSSTLFVLQTYLRRSSGSADWASCAAIVIMGS